MIWKNRAGAALATVAVVLVGMPAAMPATAEPGWCPAPDSIAHRGLSEAAPENTLASLYAAAASGVDAVELDVRFTRTEVPMLMHDSTVDRTTDGTGPIADKYVYQVRALDAGSWFSPVFADEQVPTWWEALDMLRHHDVTVIPEVKGNITNAEASNFVHRIDITGMNDNVIVSSFRPTQLAKIHAEDPDLPLAVLRASVDADPVAVAQSAGAQVYMPEHSGLTADDVDALHGAGISVIVWTADDPADWERLAEMGVDGIITNRAAQYKGWALARC